MGKKKSNTHHDHREAAEAASLREQEENKRYIFKNSSFKHSGMQTNGKKKTWRSLKQILAQERTLPWPDNIVHYSWIIPPPTFTPDKKYSDISGLSAKYFDPQTKLQYTTSDEFTTVRRLPSDIISGYLHLRGAQNPLG